MKLVGVPPSLMNGMLLSTGTFLSRSRFRTRLNEGLRGFRGFENRDRVLNLVEVNLDEVEVAKTSRGIKILPLEFEVDMD